MKTSTMWLTVIAALLVTLEGTPASAWPSLLGDSTRPTATNDTSTTRTPPPPEPPVFYRQRDLSGPRVGVTVAPGDGSLSRTLRDHGIGRFVSQFGWHFERQIVPLEGGPVLVTEAIPLIGAVEYGKLIPSVTFVVGIRTPSGIEFGMGPSFTIVNSQGEAGTGLALAAGKTLDYGGVCVPVNLAVSLNPKGTRLSLIAGYAIRRASY